MNTTARRAVVAALGMAPAVFTAASAALWWSDLPARLPTHWSDLDRPDAFSSRAATVTVVVIVTTVAGLLVVGSCAWCRRSPVIAQAVTAVGGFVGGFVAGIWVSIAASTLLAPTPARADVTWWLVLAMAAGAWALIALALTVAFARLELTVDHRGLRLVAGMVRIPLKRIRIDQVVRAEVEDLDPHRWGGWGYRILPGRSALVLRSGPALVVTTAGQRRFAATIDDPATPAALLNGLAAARQPTRPPTATEET